MAFQSHDSSFPRGAAIVTGASGGIGGAIARALAARGMPVVVHANGNIEAARALAAEIEAAGGQALALAADVTDAGAVDAMVAQAIERFGSIGVLVNNAGICTSAPIGGMDAGMIDRELGVNVKSVVLVTQACLPHMGKGAAIVNLSSNLAVSPLPGMTLYCAAKAAVACLTQGFARELGARRIRVNAVAPGATRTAMTAWIDDAALAAICGQTPLGRIGEPMDIAGAVTFLASPEASWITGRTLVIDGGLA
ncbi:MULTISPECIES: SDR family NAD(P)-dependent oxidoreductase [unclassified Novosphingobium]|uniref:SDR family NAD(P)-dependent oxidoreductase n=1 Tax=unclassified Novosphingobium TaxID=2644732 RepID=UPI00135AB7CB|nr:MULTISPECIES: glucose 1-dehydrogenase [unclassified Novosphingobium]